MPQLVQDILSTVRTLHERHLKDTVKLMPKKSPPVRKVRPHDKLCAKFVVGVDQLIAVQPKLPAPPPMVVVPQVRPMVVPGRPLAPDIQTVDSSCSVTTNVFGGLRLARDVEPRARNTGLAVVVKKEPTDEHEKECTAGSSRRAEESPETTVPGADIGETAETTVVEEDDGDEEELRVAE